MSAFFAAADPWSPGASFSSGGIGADVSTGQLGQVAISGAPSVAHPDHPFFWFALIAAATVLVVGASTSIKVGPFRESAAVKGADHKKAS
jgi:hypothetical protein